MEASRSAASPKATLGESMDTSRDVFWPYSYPPYDIQVALMRAITGTLDEGKCGVFESPTGTGKTSSIICSVVPWLLRHLDRSDKSTSLVSASESSAEEPAWIQEHEQELKRRYVEQLGFLKKRRDARFVELEAAHAAGMYEPVKRVKRGRNRVSFEDRSTSDRVHSSDDDDDDESEDEETEQRREEAEEFSKVRKLFYCSRTHTQLSQFLNEVKRVFPNKEVTAVTLGSRSHLCINDELKAKHSGNRLNDACLDLQDSSSANKCPYIKDPKIVSLVADAELFTIRDIEEVLSYARTKSACAYYASREAAKSAEIVVLPYSALLSHQTREALGIDLTDSIVVCDEAHNLIDAVADAHSCQISFQQLVSAKEEIRAYLQKYSNRFNLDNASFLAELASVAAKLSTYVEKATEACVLKLNEFSRVARVEDNNFFELVRRARDAQLHKKLKGIARELKKENTAIQPLLAFLDALKNDSNDGRVNVAPKSGLKFLLLNPGAKFAQVVEKAHSVILAGGTMHPVEDVVQQLFPVARKESVTLFSCGHIVPRENLRVFQAGFGPNNRELRLTFDTRNDNKVLEEISLCIQNVCDVCPDGVVVFLPSYSFQDTLVAHWEASGFAAKLKKSLVKETRASSSSSKTHSESETTFQEYERLIKENPYGCLLLAVVGGKLSEGINFSDHLARCVVMVGMPYPNRHDAELASKMAFLDDQHGKGAGNRYFENQCWKAVNQSVGRSIRHKNDYACVVFLDSRYATMQTKLPGWIAERFERCAEWTKVTQGLSEFFRTKPRRSPIPVSY